MKSLSRKLLCVGLVVIAAAANAHSQKVQPSEGGKEVASCRTHWDVYCVALSPDGKRIITGNAGGYDAMGPIFVLDAITGEHLSRIRAQNGGTRAVAVSRDDKRIACAGATGVKVFDADTSKQLLELQAQGEPFADMITSVALSLDGKRIVTGGGDRIFYVSHRPPGQLKLRDADTGKVILDLKGHDALVTSVAVSGDGKHLVSGSWDSTVKVWDAETGKNLSTLKGHTVAITSVAMSGDGKRIVSAGGGRFSYDKGNMVDDSDKSVEVKVWDAETGKEILDLKGQKKAVKCVTISPDGKRIAGGGLDGSVTVWDADTGRVLATLHGHRDAVNGVAFSRDGEHIISGSSDGFVKVWALTKN